MNHQNMTQLHVKDAKTQYLRTVHTYDPTTNGFIYFDLGFIPNLGRNLTDAEVQEFNDVLKQLNIEHYVIEKDGFYELNEKGQQIRSCLCFGQEQNKLHGMFGILLYKKIHETGMNGKHWCLDPVTIPYFRAMACMQWNKGM